MVTTSVVIRGNYFNIILRKIVYWKG